MKVLPKSGILTEVRDCHEQGKASLGCHRFILWAKSPLRWLQYKVNIYHPLLWLVIRGTQMRGDIHLRYLSWRVQLSWFLKAIVWHVLLGCKEMVLSFLDERGERIWKHTGSKRPGSTSSPNLLKPSPRAIFQLGSQFWGLGEKGRCQTKIDWLKHGLKDEKWSKRREGFSSVPGRTLYTSLRHETW